MKPNKPVLIYDSECSLCVRFKQALEFIDKEEKIQKTPLREKWLYQEFPDLREEECEETVHLVDTDGKILKGSEVVEFLVGFYPGVKKFSWLVESESGKKAVDFFYDKVSQIRKKIKDDCKGCGRKR